MTNGTSQGLFIAVAIIIFGIFVLISYVLFRDTLKPSLANIFTDGFNQATTALNNGSILENNINTDETNSTIYKNQLYVKIRDKNEAKDETEVWVLLEELKDGTYAIKSSGIDNTSPTYDIQGYSKGLSGSSMMTGDLILPDTINGKKITLIKEYAFYFSKFNGQLTLPNYLQSIGGNAFVASEFTGNLKLPDEMTSIEHSAFGASNFSGELILPDKLTSIGELAFMRSNFTGSLTLLDSLQSIGYNAFYFSNFTGQLHISKFSKLKSIGANAFGTSNFTGSLTLPDELTFIGESAFNCSKFSGDLILPDKLTSIGKLAFAQSIFDGQLTISKSSKLELIGKLAFGDSKFTGNLELPNNLSSIEAYAFSRSKFTGTLDISNVTNIGEYAFGNSSISTVKNDSLDNNNKTIDKKAIKMADGSYYSIN
ncbi:leucine-rich repeat domain-containing protein [Enterococcus faecium]|uniref:leucine-rich repeat domain-containing protein n=1 Tax=Enterococcus faecium TaxID=1352 RepID=UPI00190EFF66|nr:leucine-rich repeat domain-containing protein [Enterococcus faecium]MBK4849536.1 hypothetical protein [Enterococcus faecium]